MFLMFFYFCFAGLTWEETKSRCPDGVVAACHNSEDSVTISGPKDNITAFVQQLQAENIFAREVQSSGVAFHSHYMSKIAPDLKTALNKVLVTLNRIPLHILCKCIISNCIHGI